MLLNNIEQIEFERYTQVYDFSDYFNNKTFLITGSKGIVGSGLTRWLLFENSRKNCNTRIILSSRTPEKIPDYIEKGDNVTFCKFGEEDKIEEKIDYIIHTASPTSNVVFKKQPVEALHTIVNGTKGILEVQRKQPSCSLIYLSSEEVYGTPKDKEAIPESFVGRIDSLNTRSSYPLGKKTAELMCRAYFEEYGLDTKIIRPTVIIGLYQPYDSVKIEAEILRCIVENKDLYLKSSGTTKKTVIYTLDTISAVFTVLFKGESGQAYNATNPQTFNSVRDSASLLFQKFNPNCKIVFPEQDTSSALGYLPERAMLEDISRIESLGWKPMTSLEMIFRNEIQRFKHDKQNSHKA